MHTTTQKLGRVPYFANRQICKQQKKVADPWEEVKEFLVSVSLCQAPGKASVCLRPYVTVSERLVSVSVLTSQFQKISKLDILDIHVSVHHDTVQENDQQVATV